MSSSDLGNKLEHLYEQFDFEQHKNNDPIEFPRRYVNKQDKEIVAFLSALFAYGKIDLFKPFLASIFAVMGDSPYTFIMEFSDKRDSSRFSGFHYRFNKEEDLVLLMRVLNAVLRKSKSLEGLFMQGYTAEHNNIRHALVFFVDELKRTAHSCGKGGRGFYHLLPSPRNGSACKRLNLFLRWMVRDRDVDLGLWRRITRNKLVIPLDTHIMRISACLGMTNRRTVNWRVAEEISASLKKLDPEDPLKYDFALCHQGISGLCRADRTLCDACGLTFVPG